MRRNTAYLLSELLELPIWLIRAESGLCGRGKIHTSVSLILATLHYCSTVLAHHCKCC